MLKPLTITILGSNSALPTANRYPTAQVLNASERFFLIDCGEGTQQQLRANKIKFSKIDHIFISHLHGDHCFGLIGLISTFGLMGRKAPLHIHSHPHLEKLLQPQLNYFCVDLPFQVVFDDFDPKQKGLIYTDKHITVETIPLKHRIPTVGFLFKQKLEERKLKKDFVFIHQPSIKDRIAIKKGSDYINKDGALMSNKDITLDPPKPLSYAFCTDTKYTESILEQIKGVDVLYHEATFAADNAHLAKKTYHSTAEQAAQIATKAGAGKLLLGHFSSRYKNLDVLLNEAKAVFPNTFLAIEGDVIHVGQ
ncbi:RNAse Z [Saccharicrinis carchari]|uniref:Ribonuclease Z n=1 Tax=Saccharicrinis carchari TaxID=1168039 RepID=A0A521ARK1_SACCC|nr:ribonuclease Z [Saccharicrinis carchari]SMO37401.1 RNAse Z [Saccharicrinis carchari]